LKFALPFQQSCSLVELCCHACLCAMALEQMRIALDSLDIRRTKGKDREISALTLVNLPPALIQVGQVSGLVSGDRGRGLVSAGRCLVSDLL
jgi:hypothetical protein